MQENQDPQSPPLVETDDFQEIPDVQIPVEPVTPEVATGPLEFTPPAQYLSLETQADINDAFTPPETGKIQEPIDYQRSSMTSATRIGLQSVAKLGTRVVGNVIGGGIGYSLKFTDAIYEGIFGPGGVPDDVHQALTKGVTDAEVNNILDKLGIKPDTQVEEIGSEMGSMVLGTALAIHVAGVVGVTRTVGAIAPKMVDKLSWLSTWVSGAIGTAIGGGSSSGLAQLSDWGLKTSFQKWMDTEATVAQRATIQALEDIIMGGAFVVAGRAAKAVYNGVIDKVIAPMADILKPELSGALSTLEKLAELRKAKGTSPLEEMLNEPIVAPITSQILDKKTMKSLDDAIRDMTKLLESEPDNYNLKYALGDALRMKEGELPLSLGRFTRYSKSAQTTARATAAIEAAEAGVAAVVDTGEAELQGYLKRLTTLVKQDPKNPTLVDLLDNAVMMSKGERPIDLTKFAGYSIREIELRAAEQRVMKSLAALTDPPVVEPPKVTTSAVTPDIGTPAPTPAVEIPPVKLEEASPEVQAILDKIKPMTPEAEEAAEVAVHKTKLAKQGVETKATTKKAIVTAAKKSPKAVPAEELIKNAEAKVTPATASQATKAGKRVEARDGASIRPNVVKIGHHGAYITESPMDADIVAIFTKKTPPTEADSAYLQSTYDMTLADAKKIFNKNHKKNAIVIQRASEEGTQKTYYAGDKKFTDEGYADFLRPDVKKPKKIQEGSSVPPMKNPRGAYTVSFESSPVLQALGNNLPKIVSFVSTNPFIVTPVAALIDALDGDMEFSKEDYAMMMAASIGINVAKDFMGKQGLKATRSTYESMKATAAVTSNEFVGTLKGLSEAGQQNIVGHIAEDLQSKMIDIADSVMSSSHLGKASWHMGDEVINPLMSTTREVIEAGAARGSLPSIPAETFTSVPALRTYITDTIVRTVDQVRGIQLTSKGVENITERYNNWMTDWGITSDGETWLRGLHGNSPEGKQVVLAVFDGIESKALSLIEDIYKKSPTGVLTHQQATQFHQAFGALNAAADIIKTPTALLGDVTMGTEQFTRGLFMSAFPDSMVANNKYFAKYLDSIQESYNRASLWFTDGKLNNSDRRAFYEFISEGMLKNSTNMDVAKDYMFQSMLSSPETTTKAFVGNMLGTTLNLTQMGLKTVYGIAKNDDRIMLSTKFAFKNLMDSLGQSFDLMKRTAVGNTKPFDGAFDRPFNATMKDAGEMIGGSAEVAPILVRAYQRLGQYVPISPKTAMRAVDVFAQNLNRALLEGELLGKQLYDAVDSGTSLDVALEALSTRAAAAQRTAEVVGKSRAFVGLSPMTVPRVHKGIVRQELGASGHLAEWVQDTARKYPIVSAFEPMLTTATNLAQTGFEHSPWGWLVDRISPNSALAVSPEKLATMNKAARQAVLDAKLEMHTKAMSGVLLGLTLLGAYEVSGEYFVSPADAADVNLKNRLGPIGGNIVSVTADGRKFTSNNLDLLRSSLLFITGVFRDNESAYFGGLLLDSLLSAVQPKVVSDIIETTRRINRDVKEGHAGVAMMLNDLALEIGNRFTDPALLRWVRQVSSGEMDKPTGLMTQEPQQFLTGQVKTRAIPSLRQFALGPESNVPMHPVTKVLGDSGIDTSRSEPFTWRGMTVDDPTLNRLLRNQVAKLLPNEDIGGGNALVSRLTKILNPQLRNKAAKEFVSMARAEAMRMHSALLDGFYEERISNK